MFVACYSQPDTSSRSELLRQHNLCHLRTLGESGDAGQDFIGAFVPHKGFWIDIVRFKKLINGALQLALTRNHKWV
jgi:hypothetical protein